MSRLRCFVARGLPKEVQEEINKFLETTPCQVHHVLQSESKDHTTITIFYEIDLPVGDDGEPPEL